MNPIRTLICATSLLAAVTTASAGEHTCCSTAPAAEPFSPLSLYQLDATFTDDRGETVTLAAFRGQPVVLTMFFASCGYACPMLVSDITRIRAMLSAGLRENAAIVLVSFDTERDTPAVLANYRAERSLDGQWHLLHGGTDAVSELAALLGVKYRRETNGMFSHSNLITVLNHEGEIIHQREGLQGGLEETAQALTGIAP